MKFFFFVALLFFTFSANAQKFLAINADSLDRYPYYLNKEWKFIDADSPSFSSPDYDDSKAIVINPILNKKNPDSKIFKGIGWFRLHFKIDASLADEQIALALTTLGATEIYIDGKFFKKFGSIDPAGTTTYYDPQEIPFVIKINDTGKHLLAIRYANYNADRNSEVYHYQEAGFKIMIGKADLLIYQKNLRSTVIAFTLMFLSGIFFALSLLHLFMFLYYRSERSNLSFSIFMFCLGSTFVIFFVNSATHNPEIELKIRWLLIPFLGIACLALSGFINEHFARKKGVRFWAIVTLVIGSIFFGFFGSNIYPMIAMALLITVSIEAFVIVLVAIFKKIKGARIIGAGILLLTLFILVLFMIALTSGNSIELNDNTTGGSVLLLFLALAILSTPISMSIYQAWQFAHVNKSLVLQLDNVKVLSQKSIKYEQEKQRMLENRKEELEEEIKLRTDELRESQAQLIQQEKIASLGELTAGIAHEIQNPLNFVNNFSEVNTELIDEMVEEVDKGNIEEVKAIAKDIRDNEQKINHHGKRADAIVKGMLQHSRSTNNATIEPTDINKLADEYLRLAYHGLRAKDKSFNATMKTNFDDNIGNINIIPQDIGRVILNLISNAFYAVNEKANSGAEGYAPTVSVGTKKMGDKVEISVGDNGNGIPKKILDKIFQPFFTTKPTGQGTGLGLSLSYDIVKAHGGELKVETTDSEGTSFIIILPA